MHFMQGWWFAISKAQQTDTNLTIGSLSPFSIMIILHWLIRNMIMHFEIGFIRWNSWKPPLSRQTPINRHKKCLKWRNCEVFVPFLSRFFWKRPCKTYSINRTLQKLKFRSSKLILYHKSVWKRALLWTAS